MTEDYSNHPDQLELVNPVDRYASISPPEQRQEEPGLESEMIPQPDIGEHTYRGTGRLVGRKALVTGGDSGIGAATAVAFAREGADVAITYLAEEETDAQHVADIITKTGQRAVTIPGDLTDPAFCSQVVERADRGAGSPRRAGRRRGQADRHRGAGGSSASSSADVLSQHPGDVPSHQAGAGPPRARVDDHRHDLDPGIPAHLHPPRLRRDQGRDQRLLQGSGRGAGAAPASGERRRSGPSGRCCGRAAASRPRRCRSSAEHRTRTRPTHGAASAYVFLASPESSYVVGTTFM